MALNTANYGYLVDPLLPIVDEAGQIVKGGFIVVLESSTSAKVYTYNDWNESLNPVQITIDNSGRVGSYVIVNKDKLYKILVCDAAHGEENPIRVVDKVAVTGANVTNTGAITQGLNSAQSSLSSVTVTVTDNKLYVGGTLDQSLSTINSKLNAIKSIYYVDAGSSWSTFISKVNANYVIAINDSTYGIFYLAYVKTNRFALFFCTDGSRNYKLKILNNDGVIEFNLVETIDEPTARQAADSALDGKITAEATARSNADTALGNRLTAVENLIPTAASDAINNAIFDYEKTFESSNRQYYQDKKFSKNTRVDFVVTSVGDASSVAFSVNFYCTDGTTKSYSLYKLNETKSIVLDKDCTRILFYNNSDKPISGSFKVVSLQKQIVEADSNIADNKTSVSYLENQLPCTNGVLGIEETSTLEWEEGFLVYNNGSISKYDQYKHSNYIEVRNGMSFSTNSYAGGTAGYIVYDKDKKYLYGVKQNQSGVKTYTIESESAMFLRISNDFASISNPSFVLKYPTKENVKSSVIEGLKDNISSLAMKADKIPTYEELVYEVNSGAWVDVMSYNGSSYSETNARNIKITSGFSSGDKIFVSGFSVTGEMYGLIGFFDANNKHLSHYWEKDKAFTRKEFTIPSGTAEIRVNGRKSNPPKIESISCYKNLEDVEEEINQVGEGVSLFDFFSNNAFSRIAELQKSTPFAINVNRPVLTFTFDDTLADVKEIADLFESKGVPCCFASVPENLSAFVSGSSTITRGSALIAAQSNGCEILTHGYTAMSANVTDKQIYDLFVGNKKKLVDYGFNVDGIIEVGSGGGETSFDYTRCEKYLKSLYRYSDNYGRNLNLPQFFPNNRKWMSSTLSSNKAFVDSAVSNNKWYMMSAHGVSVSGGIGLQVLSDTIDYAISQGCEILTMRGVYNEYSNR